MMNRLISQSDGRKVQGILSGCNFLGEAKKIGIKVRRSASNDRLIMTVIESVGEIQPSENNEASVFLFSLTCFSVRG